MAGAAIAIFADRGDRGDLAFQISRLNSPAFPKCARCRDFLRLLRRIASKAKLSGWAILSREFSKLPHRCDRRKKSPGVSASIGGDQIHRDRRIKSPGVSLAEAGDTPGEFNHRYLTCQISAILYADRGDRRKSQSLHRAHLVIFADRRDRRIKSPGVSPALSNRITLRWFKEKLQAKISRPLSLIINLNYFISQ